MIIDVCKNMRINIRMCDHVRMYQSDIQTKVKEIPVPIEACVRICIVFELSKD